MMPFRTPLVRRTLASAAIAAAALGGLTACDLFAPQDTLYIEEASVGPSATVGNVFVGNAVLVQGDGDTANFVATLVNTGSSTEQVTIAPTGGQPIEVSVKPGQTKRLGNPPSEETLVTGLDAKPGGLTNVSVTSGGDSVGLQVPIVTHALQPYGTLTPVPQTTETPSSSSTPSPTPSK
jgi:hypothetical protein